MDERLSDLLHDAVAGVEPSNRLAEVRDRAGAGAAGRRRRTWYAGGGAVLVAASVTVTLVAVGGNDQPPDGPGPVAASRTRTAAGPTPTPTPSASAPVSTAGKTVPVTAYFVGDTPDGPALFGERHDVPIEEQLNAPIALLMRGPSDPDYRTLWPEGSLRDGVGFNGIGDAGAFEVELADPTLTERPADMTEREAELAVQQVIWSLQSAGTMAAVDFYAASRNHRVLGVPAPPRGIQAARDLDTLALVNVLSPGEGSRVSGSFLAAGTASSFEATIPWQLRDADGRIVKDGFAVAEGWVDRVYPWQTEVDVSDVTPGTYTFAAMTDDPTGGTEGRGPTTDTRTLLVE